MVVYIKRPVCDTRLCNVQFITMQSSQCTIKAIQWTEKALFLTEYEKNHPLALTYNQLYTTVNVLCILFFYNIFLLFNTIALFSTLTQF